MLEEKFDGLVSVGDMGYLDEEGFLYVCDRASDMVISGGVNIYPAEIEHVLIGLPGVAESGATLDVDVLRRELGQRIAGYKVPRRIDIVAALPRDDNGKLQKREIRDAYWSGRSRRI